MAEVKTIAVIGAGIMGRGIAHVAAMGGYRTILEDILPASLRRAETEIRAILATNTSSLSITEISSVTYRAKKCLGMHFFNPVHKMKLLEVVRGLETDQPTLDAAAEVGRRMGKEVVVIKESPGFITSRINAM